jgi:Skp family chaperone for outer membrane proteins
VTRLAFLLVAAILLAGPSSTTLAQGTAASSTPHKVALIDISRVLKEYKKVDALRSEIKAEIAKSETQRTAMVKQMNIVKDKLKSPNIQQGSAKAVELEKQGLKIEAEFNSFKKGERTRILRREAQLLKTIHGEIKAVVKRAADAWGYTLVLRFNSTASDAATPNNVVGQLQRQVVYHRGEDDITQPVIEYLNKQYLKQSPVPRTGAQPAGATKTKKR